MNFKDNAVILLATGCYVGKIPKAPGTAGSLVGILGCLVLSRTQLSLAVMIAVIFVFLAVWIATEAEKLLNQTDPGCIVIDEVAAQCLVLTAVPASPAYFVAAFVAFRIADIVKPWPASWADRSIKGGFGIMIDDILAGAYAWALLYGIVFVLN